jgi:hypothetical protein
MLPPSLGVKQGEKAGTALVLVLVVVLALEPTAALD